jgi:3-hydroxymyristoyl/3-hydroxydecanoyl-(acyl carrier protein) dehydratase
VQTESRGLQWQWQERDAQSAQADCVIMPNHPDFEGHFELKPVFPACAQFDLILLLLRHWQDKPLYLRGVPRAKFLGLVSPGDALKVHLWREHLPGEFAFEMKRGDSPVSRGRVMVSEQRAVPGGILT